MENKFTQTVENYTVVALSLSEDHILDNIISGNFDDIRDYQTSSYNDVYEIQEMVYTLSKISNVIILLPARISNDWDDYIEILRSYNTKRITYLQYDVVNGEDNTTTELMKAFEKEYNIYNIIPE